MTADTTPAPAPPVTRPPCVDCGGKASGIWTDVATGESQPMCDDCALGGEAPTPEPTHDRSGLLLEATHRVTEWADPKDLDPGPAIVLAGMAVGAVVGWFTLGYFGVVAVGFPAMVVSFVIWRWFAIRSLEARGITQPRYWGAR